MADAAVGDNRLARDPVIFVSAVTRELKSARQLVANTLIGLGYQAVWQDIFGTEQGDLRGMLRRQIDACHGVVQLVGRRYGAEPPVPEDASPRMSYTQFEAALREAEVEARLVHASRG